MIQCCKYLKRKKKKYFCHEITSKQPNNEITIEINSDTIYSSDEKIITDQPLSTKPTTTDPLSTKSSSPTKSSSSTKSCLESPNPITKKVAFKSSPKIHRHIGYTHNKIYIDTYRIIHSIGKGSFGQVHKVKDIHTGNIYAMKSVALSKDENIYQEEFISEIIFHENYYHPNIVKRHDIFYKTIENEFSKIYNKTHTCIYMIYEYMDTDLYSLYTKYKLDHIHYIQILQDVLSAIKYLHSLGIIHRDIKPQNILIQFDGETCRAKLADFGSCYLPDKDIDYKINYIVTRWYRSPDIIFERSLTTSNIDLWALGCVFYEIIAKKPLFNGDDSFEMIKQIVSMFGEPPYIDDLDFKYKNVILSSSSNFNTHKFKLTLLPSYYLNIIECLLQYTPSTIDSIEKKIH